MKPYRVLIADDEAYFRRIISALLQEDDRFEVVRDDFPSGAGVVEAVVQERIDLALLDVRMGPPDGIHTALALTEHAPQCKFVLVTSFNTFDYANYSARLGSHGHLLKHTAAQNLIPPLLRVMNNVTTFDDEVTSTLVEGSRDVALIRRQIRAESLWESLTQRERETAVLICRGHTREQVAEFMNLSASSVKKHLASVYQKASIETNVELAGLLAIIPRLTAEFA